MLARLAIFALGMVVFLVVVAVSLPANWLARYVEWRSNGMVLLADAKGNVWSGDAVIGIAANGVSRALPGRMAWNTHWIFPDGVAIDLTDGDLLAHPVSLHLTPTESTLDAGDAQLPLGLAVLAGAPLNTVGPNGLMSLHWDPLAVRAGVVSGAGSLHIIGLSVAINPVKPLGDYLVTWQYAQQGLTWALTTDNGPLELEAHGSGLDRAHFAGRAGIAKGVPDATAQRLWPLLEALGPRQGDSVQITIGAY